jgi:hypothetical protein
MAGTDENAPKRLSPIPEHTPPDIARLEPLYTHVRDDLSATRAKRLWNRRTLSRLEGAYKQCVRSDRDHHESVAKVPKPGAWELTSTHASHREAVEKLSREIAKISKPPDSVRQLQSYLDERARALDEERHAVINTVRPMSNVEVTAAVGSQGAQSISRILQSFESRSPVGIAPGSAHPQTGNPSTQTPAASAHSSAPTAAGQAAPQSRPRRRKLTRNPARKPVPTQQGPDRKGPSLLQRLSQKWTR